MRRNGFRRDPGLPGRFWLGALTALAVGTATLPASQAAPLRTDTTFLTVDIDGPEQQLEVMMARPAAGGPFPVALITHGTSGAALAASAMRPEATFGGWIRDFANRGYFAVGVMRRGYGRSDGAVTRDAGTCEKPDLRRYFERDADDLSAVLAVLATWPDVDASRLVVIGQSAGGLDALAVAARLPGRKLAVVNVSGGLYRFENRDGLEPYNAYDGCAAFRAAMIDLLQSYAARVRAPTLWLYAQNDPWFLPPLVGYMKEAWLRGGGFVELEMLAPSAINGHNIFFEHRSRGALLPLIDAFLGRVGLPTWTKPDVAALAGPLSEAQRAQLSRYLRMEGAEKALAIADADSKNLYWASGRPTIGRAVTDALVGCRAATGASCKLLMRNFEVASPERFATK